MFEKHGGRSLLRQPGTSLLTLLLSLLVATLLGTSLGLRALVEQTIRDCSERYLTIGVVDYLNGDDATDPVTIADYAARIAALPLPGSAREYEPTQEAMGWFPDYEADINTPWSRDEAVLVVRARQPQK